MPSRGVRVGHGTGTSNVVIRGGEVHNGIVRPTDMTQARAIELLQRQVYSGSSTATVDTTTSDSDNEEQQQRLANPPSAAAQRDSSRIANNTAENQAREYNIRIPESDRPSDTEIRGNVAKNDSKMLNFIGSAAGLELLIAKGGLKF